MGLHCWKQPRPWNRLYRARKRRNKAAKRVFCFKPMCLAVDGACVSSFLTNIKAGATIDHGSDPELQEAGKAAVNDFCTKTGINLAGFDLLFPDHEQETQPLFLEINYFFGRRGLGGSMKYYQLVDEAVGLWLKKIGLSL
jgi:hypothetical protein